MEKDRTFSPSSGYTYVILMIALIAGAVLLFTMMPDSIFSFVLGPTFLVLAFLIAPGFLVLDPNEAAVLILFGAYKGTIKVNGFYWLNPFLVKKKVSLRARNLNSDPLNVNDKLGNPIMIGIVLVWKVEDHLPRLNTTR